MSSFAPTVRTLAGLLATALGACIFAGCYTALSHPGAADVMDDYGYQEKSCYDCHDEAAFYHSYYGVHFDYYGAPWFGYYGDPWWYDAYWHGDDAPAPTTRGSEGRHQWRRSAPSGSPRGSAGSSSTAPFLREGYSKKSQKEPDEPKADDPKEKKKASDKKRRASGRRKK